MWLPSISLARDRRLEPRSIRESSKRRGGTSPCSSAGFRRRTCLHPSYLQRAQKLTLRQNRLLGRKFFSAISVFLKCLLVRVGMKISLKHRVLAQGQSLTSLSTRDFVSSLLPIARQNHQQSINNNL